MSVQSKVNEIEECIRDLLVERSEVLDLWRKQTLTKSRRVKNFETWLLLEVVSKILTKYGGKVQVRTNATLGDKYIRPNNLKGAKAKAGNIYPDISLKFSDETILDFELKTQTSPQVLHDDLKIIRENNMRKADTGKYGAVMLWVVIAPDHSDYGKMAIADVERFAKKRHDDGIEIPFMWLPNRLPFTDIEDWLMISVSTPGLAGRDVRRVA